MLWGKAELKPLTERVASLEAEKATLTTDLGTEKDESQKLRVLSAGAEAREKAQEEKYAQMKTDLGTSFGNLAAEALRANNQSFLMIAKQELGGQTSEVKQTMEFKELAIKKLLDPLSAALMSLDKQSREMETKRAGAYSEVKTLVENIQSTIPASLDALKSETAQLITALRAPKTRGNWGELQLKRCVEYAGMVQYCSF